jgi:glycosyltransferase involved in cell wall biosynthesis
VEFGVNLVGYFRSETGVGQSARGACAALRSVSVPVSLRCANDGGPTLKQDQTVGPMSTTFPYTANLFYVNADEAPHVKQSFGDAFYRNRRNIGFWVWELDEFPEEWRNSFSMYHEIWTPSTFCRDAIARVSPIPVHAIPYAVAPQDPPGMDRQYFGLPQDPFLFLSAFDALSVVERKNPFGSMQAFRSAFGDDPRYQLILKVNNAAYARRKIDTLKDACGPNVRIVESTLSREEMYALVRCCDCAVSLHRSEGFGLFIAEAMYFGKPVIATNYSGNTDFTSADNCLLVDYQLIPVGKNCAPYNPHAKWADPNLAQAAAHMTLVAKDSSFRTHLGRAGSDFVRRELSEQAVGAKMRRRLEEARMPSAQLATRVAAAGGSRKWSAWSST